MRNFVIIAGGCAVMVATTAQASKPVDTGTATQVQRLMDCRAITAADERLACFDRVTARRAVQRARANNAARHSGGRRRSRRIC